MSTRRPGTPELVAGLAGFAVVLLMSGVNWFVLDGPAEGTLGGFDAWQAFSALDVLLFVSGSLGVALAIQSARGSTSRALEAVTGFVALVAAVLLVIRIADPPTFDSTLGNLKLSRDTGAYAGLAAVAVLGAAATLGALRRGD